jgi:hypothetical protein
MNGYKKHRGLRRYYRGLSTVNHFGNACPVNFDNPETWQKNWHIHLDYRGYGNNNFKRRAPHLNMLFRHFDILVEKTKNLEKPFQLYAIILDYDSYDDALFLHTPNPNNSQFPFQVTDLQPTTTLTNKPLNDYVDQLAGYEKKYGLADEAFCLLFKRGVGEPLW